MSEDARQAYNEYQRKYRAEHPACIPKHDSEKTKKYQQNYWERKAQKLKQEKQSHE